MIAANTNASYDGCFPGASGSDVISLPAGTYNLTGPAGDDASANGDLDIDPGGGPLTILGSAIDANEQPTSIIDANNVDRAIHVIPDALAGDVQLLALGVRNGNATADGGGLLVGDPDADVVIDTTRWQGNDTTDYGGAVHFGDGVTGSSIYIEQSEFSGNTAGEEGAPSGSTCRMEGAWQRSSTPPSSATARTRWAVRSTSARGR